MNEAAVIAVEDELSSTDTSNSMQRLIKDADCMSVLENISPSVSNKVLLINYISPKFSLVMFNLPHGRVFVFGCRKYENTRSFRKNSKLDESTDLVLQSFL